MWRWTIFLCLLIFYGPTSSQPVTDDSENARQARQLDFGECCPCPGAGQADRDFGTQEFSRPSGDGSFARGRDLDDCPCRPQHADSEGASSMFFPTSMRSGGPVMRPVEKKEDFKPLLHPEVDLASSVLQTLRDATDEEYQDALARDAARSMAKAAEETVFGDATPEASTGNIVTIIVNPKQTDNLDDVIPQESRVQESRCIQAPLESARTNLGKMQVASKPPSLLREIFGLPRISKPAGLQHKKILDMDSGVGASNIQERVVHVDGDQITNKGQGLRKYSPLMKLDSKKKIDFLNVKSNMDDDFSVSKMPDFKSPNLKNKLKDFISSRSSQGIGKISSFPVIPKMKLNNSLSKTRAKNNEDLSYPTKSPSNILEQETEKNSFFRTKSHLENILENTRPVGLKNLLKLKDVELIPLKDLVNKAAERPKFIKPKFVLPAIFNADDDDVISSSKNNNPIKRDKSTEIIETKTITSKIETLDHEVSPSNVIEQISDTYCNSGAFKMAETGVKDGEDMKSSPEIVDTVPSPSGIQIIDKNTYTDHSQSDELTDNTDDCEMKTMPVTETNLFESTDASLDAARQDSNESELNSDNTKDFIPDNAEEQENGKSSNVFNIEDCGNNNDDGDSITDSSNKVSTVFEPKDTVPENSNDLLIHKNITMDENCSQEQQANDNLKTLDSNPQKIIIKPISLDETLSSVRDIIKKLDYLKNHKSSSRNLNVFDEEIPNNNIENKETSPIMNENQDTDCQNEESIEITTVKPEVCNDDLENTNESPDKISMQDLQKISDSMLQQEEQKRESKTIECSEQSKEANEPNIPLEVNSRETESLDSENSANSLNEVVMVPQNFYDGVNIKEENVKNTCQRDLISSKQSLDQQSDADFPQNSDDGVKINEENVENTCQSDLKSSKQSLEQQSDANFEASEVVIHRIPQNKDIISSPLLLNKVVQPEENASSFLRNQLPDIKLAPLPTLDEMKMRLNSLFDKNVRNVEEFSTSEAESMTSSSNILSPIMATDASTTNFQYKSAFPLRLEDIDLDILQLKPQSGFVSKIPKIDLHSYKTKLPLSKDLRFKPVKLQSALEDKGNIFGATLNIGRNNVRPSDKSHKITKVSDNLWETIPNLDDFRKLIKTDTQKTLNKKPVKLQSHDFLEAISRNHEDVTDKLRALHIDFNDRIETMRNNLFDKSRLGTSDRQANTKSFSTFGKQSKGKQSSLKTGQSKTGTGRREPNRKSQILPNQKTFKMPAAASVPVPKTIEIPELKATLGKSPGLEIRRASDVNPNILNLKPSQAQESTVALWKQANKKLHNSNSPLGKQINAFKDSKIKVSISTTPRPTIATKLQSRQFTMPTSHLKNTNSGNNRGRLGSRVDHNGSPSEISNSIVSSPIVSQPNPQNVVNKSILSRKLGRKDNIEADTQSRNSNELQSWPKVSESAFLSKVKEAVKARMSKVNSPVTLKQSDVQNDLTENEESLKWNSDMTRSASENTDVILGQALKENVSYKCTMVCTKE